MKKSDTKSIKNNNTALILRCLLSGAESRAQIAKTSGLSKATVTQITGELIESGLLSEVGFAEETAKERRAGRRQTALKLCADYRYAVGISLHRRRLSVCLSDLAFGVHGTRTFSYDDFSSPTDALDALWEGALALCAEENVSPALLIGIGVSSPGPLDYKNGIIRNPAGLSLFHGFSVKGYLEKKSALPVFLDNNAVLLALQERRLRKNAYPNFIFTIAADGIGSAFFSDGELFRGSGGYAGELGHTTVEPDGAPCPCGGRGCLERALSPAALREKFGFESYAALADGAAEGDEAARRALSHVADLLARALVNYVNLIDPDAVVLYGDFAYRSALLIPLLEERFSAHSAIASVHPVAILPSLIAEENAHTVSAHAIIDAFLSQKL